MLVIRKGLTVFTNTDTQKRQIHTLKTTAYPSKDSAWSPHLHAGLQFSFYLLLSGHLLLASFNNSYLVSVILCLLQPPVPVTFCYSLCCFPALVFIVPIFPICLPSLSVSSPLLSFQFITPSLSDVTLPRSDSSPSLSCHLFMGSLTFYLTFFRLSSFKSCSFWSKSKSDCQCVQFEHLQEAMEQFSVS